MIDREALREDYINGMSIRNLSVKYDVPRSTIGRWVKKYGWVPEHNIRKIQPLEGRDDCVPLVRDEWDGSLSEAGDRAVADYELIRSYVLKILDKADQILKLDDALAPRDLKSMTSMMLDVKMLLGAQSPAEAKEHELRVRVTEKTLEQQAGPASAEPTVVQFVDLEGADV